MLFTYSIFGKGWKDAMKPQRNYVHKYSAQVNKPATHQDQKKEDKKSGKVRDELRNGISDWRHWAQ
jgi:hypothetical protein